MRYRDSWQQFLGSQVASYDSRCLNLAKFQAYLKTTVESCVTSLKIFKIQLSKLQNSCLNVSGRDVLIKKWCEWIQLILTYGTLSIKINNIQGLILKLGMSQTRGSLIPFLYKIAVDTLAKMANLAQTNNLIKGLVPEYINNGVAILQYADDAILCILHSR